MKPEWIDLPALCASPSGFYWYRLTSYSSPEDWLIGWWDEDDWFFSGENEARTPEEVERRYPRIQFYPVAPPPGY